MKNHFFSHWYLYSIAAIVAVKNWLLEVVPFVPRANETHDDGLFIEFAGSIVKGYWFGAYDHMTLIKGPIYPLWLALNYYIGFDVIHSQDLLYLLACLITVRAVSLDLNNKLMGLIFFSLLYLNPVSIDFASISHAFRMVIYTSLSLMTIGALIGLFLRITKSKHNHYLWSTLFGVSFSLFWYCREEGMWLVPAIVFLFLVLIIQFTINKDWRGIRNAVVGIVIIPGILFGIISGALIYMNWKHYKAPYVVEVTAPSFSRAYNALLSIENDEFLRFYPVRAKTIEHLQQLSPKANELATFMGRPDFHAYQFIWVLRSAVNHAGYYKQGAQAVDKYYAELANEIEQLCLTNQLKCNKQIMSNVPPWQPVYTKEFLDEFKKQILAVVNFPKFSTSQMDWYAYGDNDYMNQVGRLTHSRMQIRRGEITKDINDMLFIRLERFKKSVLETLGLFQLSIRPYLCLIALLMLITLSCKNLTQRRYNPFVLISYSVLGSTIVLCLGLTIIELTAYGDLFRPRHGALVLPPLFIISVFLALILEFKDPAPLWLSKTLKRFNFFGIKSNGN